MPCLSTVGQVQRGQQRGVPALHHRPAKHSLPAAAAQGVEHGAAQQLTSLLAPQLRCVCDVKAAGGQDYYRLSDDKVGKVYAAGAS